VKAVVTALAQDHLGEHPEHGKEESLQREMISVALGKEMEMGRLVMAQPQRDRVGRPATTVQSCSANKDRQSQVSAKSAETIKKKISEDFEMFQRKWRKKYRETEARGERASEEGPMSSCIGRGQQ